MGILNGSETGATHHHGPLAGARAAAVAVIVIPLLAIFLARHLIMQALGVLIWAVVVLVIAACIAAVLYLYRWLYHRHLLMSAAAAALPAAPVRMEATVLPASASYAEVTAVPVAQIGPAPAAAITAGVLPAADAGRVPVHLHLPPGMDPADVAAVLASLRGHDEGGSGTVIS